MPILTTPFDTTTLNLRVLPWDLDTFMELNNGRYLTLMDLGRCAHGSRMGLFELLKTNEWGLMVGAVSTRYRHRLVGLQAFQLHSQLTYFDDRWFYFRQWFTSEKKGKTVTNASFLVRTAVTSKKGLVPTQEVIDQMHFDEELVRTHNQPSDWLLAWVKSDEFHKEIMEA